MSLPSLFLDAFVEVCRTRHFSNAAKNLFITQSALTQRIQKLEEEIHTKLFVRNRSQVSLTEAGEQLLKYCRIKDSIESEFLSQINSRHQGSVGRVRIAGYSTVMRSIILPSLKGLFKSTIRLNLESQIKELRDIPQLLRDGAADFIILDHPLEDPGIISKLLGYEKYVHVESAQATTQEGTYLNHDSSDQMTFEYFKKHGLELPAHFNRSYLDEIYSVIDGVAHGFGRSILPEHLIKNDTRIRILNPDKFLKIPVYLVYFEDFIQTTLNQQLIEILLDHPKTLSTPLLT